MTATATGITSCPNCGGAVWDNRAKKAAGEMKPNAPDYSCRDKEGCKWALWPPRKASNKPATPPVKASPKWTWELLGRTARRAMVQAAAAMKGITPPATSDNVTSLGISLFIEVCRSGVNEPPTKEELSQRPDFGEDDEESGVPF